MKPRKPTAPSHVDLVRQADRECPALSWRERQANRRLWKSYSRARKAPACEFDPLEMRLGLQANLRQDRPYYAIWSPLYHEILRSKPAIDASLPGPAWLATVYHSQWRDLVTLPGARAVLQARSKVIADQYRAPTPRKATSPQADLFAMETP